MHCAKGTCNNTWGETRTNEPDSRTRSRAEKDEPEGHFEAGFSSAEDKVRIISESLTLLLSRSANHSFHLQYIWLWTLPKSDFKIYVEPDKSFLWAASKSGGRQGEAEERGGGGSGGGWKRRGWQWRRLAQTSSPLRTQRQTLPITGRHCNLVAISRTDTLLQLLWETSGIFCQL